MARTTSLTPLGDADLIRAARRDPTMACRVAVAVAALPAAYREALTLHLDDDLPPERVADITRVHLSAACQRIARAQAYVCSSLSRQAADR